MKILCQQKCIAASPEERDMFSCQPTSSLSQSYHNIKKMVRQCITVSVFILVINCLLSTRPCLSLFHLSLELLHFCVTGGKRKVAETQCGMAALPPVMQNKATKGIRWMQTEMPGTALLPGT